MIPFIWDKSLAAYIGLHRNEYQVNTSKHCEDEGMTPRPALFIETQPPSIAAVPTQRCGRQTRRFLWKSEILMLHGQAPRIWKRVTKFTGHLTDREASLPVIDVHISSVLVVLIIFSKTAARPKIHVISLYKKVLCELFCPSSRRCKDVAQRNWNIVRKVSRMNNLFLVPSVEYIEFFFNARVYIC